MSSIVSREYTLWIGTYPAAGIPGSGEGIWRARLTAAGVLIDAELVAAVPSPSFLALSPDGRSLYAVGELPEGTLTAFDVLDDAPWLAPRGPVVFSGGELPCHLVATDETVWVANYGDGTLSMRRLDDDGGWGAATDVAHTGAGPDSERQAGSHAHFVAALDGRPVVVDLGTDEIRDHRDPRATRVLAALPPGTGPRHLAELGGGALAVVGELDPAVFVLVPHGMGYTVAARYDACSSAPVSGLDLRNYPSHVAVSADGRRLYVAVRGADVISVFAIDRDGDIPVLRPWLEFSCGGRWPRHFAVLDGGSGPGLDDARTDLVVVANQESDTLAVFAVDAAGAVTPTGTAALPAPACVVEGWPMRPQRHARGTNVMV